MLHLKTVNKKIKDKHYDVTLYKGDGYFYMEFSGYYFAHGDIFETRSIYVNSLNELTLDEWLEEAQELVNHVWRLYK